MQIKTTTLSSTPIFRLSPQPGSAAEQPPTETVTLGDTESRPLNVGLGLSFGVTGALFGSLTGLALASGGKVGVAASAYTGMLAGGAVGSLIDDKSDSVYYACSLTGVVAGTFAGAAMTGQVGGPALIAGLGLASAAVMGLSGLRMEP